MPGFEFKGDWSGRVVATAIHAGHDVRPELAELMVLPDDVRFREEDPFTDRIGARIPARVVAHTSRFEVDFNRPREGAVYRSPEEAWGLDIWRTPPLAAPEVETSLAVYDAFYRAVAERFDALAAQGPFVVFDVHSYNHRRDGEDSPESPLVDNPAARSPDRRDQPEQPEEPGDQDGRRQTRPASKRLIVVPGHLSPFRHTSRPIPPPGATGRSPR